MPVQLDPAIARQDILDALEGAPAICRCRLSPDDPVFNWVSSLNRLNIIDQHRNYSASLTR